MESPRGHRRRAAIQMQLSELSRIQIAPAPSHNAEACALLSADVSCALPMYDFKPSECIVGVRGSPYVAASLRSRRFI